MAILSNPTNAYHKLAIKEVNVAAQALGVQLQLLEARDASDGAFAAMAKERVGALLVLSDVIFNSHGARLADLAASARLPTAHAVRESVEVGGLMSYGPSFLNSYQRSAAYVDKILKGTKPADLPVEQPTKFELVINLQTAKRLGLTPPATLLSRADEVIETSSPTSGFGTKRTSQRCPQFRSLTGVNRTWRGQPISVENDPKQTSCGCPSSQIVKVFRFKL